MLGTITIARPFENQTILIQNTKMSDIEIHTINLQNLPQGLAVCLTQSEYYIKFTRNHTNFGWPSQIGGSPLRRLG